MSFLLAECKEMNYNDLVAINGGCNSSTKNNSNKSNNNNSTNLSGNKNKNKNNDSSKTTNTYTTTTTTNKTNTTTTTSTTTTTKTATSNVCNSTVPKPERTSNGDYTKTIGQTGDKTIVNPINTSTADCKGAAISYHSQLMFTDSNMKGGTKFGTTACGATSIINELSEQYSKETGRSLTDAQVIDAMKKAVDAGKIRGTDAFVKDWGGAAQVMSQALGLKGKWTYTENAKEATAVIISIDTDGKDKNFDGYHDHFVNDIGNGQYYDPYTNKIGYIKDLHLTKAWADDDGIKSAYRYLKYSTK